MKHYPSALMAIHWLTAIAVVVAYVSGGDPTHSKMALDVWVGSLHVAAGLVVLALVLARVPTRLWYAKHLPVATIHTGHLGLPGLLGRMASLAHAALYTMMVATPLLGWVALSDKASQFSIWGAQWSLPLLQQGSSWLHPLAETHEIVADIFIALVGIHAAAALLHHFILKDHTLVSMLPASLSRKLSSPPRTR